MSVKLDIAEVSTATQRFLQFKSQTSFPSHLHLKGLRIDAKTESKSVNYFVVVETANQKIVICQAEYLLGNINTMTLNLQD